VNFSDFKLSDGVIEGLEAMGFEKPTPIQEKSIPIILEKKDVIGIAQTGTGKTAAFLLPTMSYIQQNPSDHIHALIVVPTRELAMQIDQAIQGFGYFAGISSMAIYGGGDASEFSQEKKALTEGVDIVVATPGRLISHLNLGYVDFKKLDCLILDEADRMLDMGFYADITKIVGYCNDDRQSLMYSATMPDNIYTLAKKILKNPETVSIALSKPSEKILQVAYSIYKDQKIPLITSLLKDKDLKSILVFTSRKSTVSELNQVMKRKGFNCAPISSDLEQNDREQVMLDFRNRKIQILIATDVVSRGIDIEDIDLVINYDVPNDAEDYVHRIGRTARASKSGMAMTFIIPDEQFKFAKIEQLIGSEIVKSPINPEIGPTPPYNPKAPRKGGGYRGGGNNRRFNGKRKGGPKRR